MGFQAIYCHRLDASVAAKLRPYVEAGSGNQGDPSEATADGRSHRHCQAVTPSEADDERTG